MGDLSPHFSTHEFACKCKLIGGTREKGYCAGDVKTSDHLVRVLEQLIDDLTVDTTHRVRVIITSGYRCPQYNRRVGGATHSQHCEGIAADIVVKHDNGSAMSPDDVAQYLEDKYPDKYGIGRYKGWTHIDVRNTKARWGNR